MVMQLDLVGRALLSEGALRGSKHDKDSAERADPQIINILEYESSLNAA